jgi:hypothetical protein
LFKAFGWPGYKEAGATLENPISMAPPKEKSKTKFVDLLWPSEPPKRAGCLIEMKKRHAKLEQHYPQAFEYWHISFLTVRGT